MNHLRNTEFNLMTQNILQANIFKEKIAQITHLLTFMSIGQHSSLTQARLKRLIFKKLHSFPSISMSLFYNIGQK